MTRNADNRTTEHTASELVKALLDEAHVECVQLDGGAGGIQQAESDGYGLRGPQRGYVR